MATGNRGLSDSAPAALGSSAGRSTRRISAHLVCAQEAHRELALDRVLLIPAAIPPHKPVEHEPGAEHRLQMCRLAVGRRRALRRSPTSSYIARGRPITVDTLTGLSEQRPNDELVLILGGDIAAGLPEWHQPERVLELATVAIAEAAGHPPRKVDQRWPRCGDERARFFEMPRIEDLLDDGPPPRRPGTRSATSSPTRCSTTSTRGPLPSEGRMSTRR